MHILGRIFVDVIITMFFVGLAGSAVVILIAFVEDFRELFGSDDTAQEVSRPSQGETTARSSSAPQYTPPRPNI